MQGKVFAMGGLLVAFVMVIVILPLAPASAQDAGSTTATLPDPLTPEAIQALVARLSDRKVRDLLLKELGARAKPTAAETAPKPSVTDAIAAAASEVAT